MGNRILDPTARLVSSTVSPNGADVAATPDDFTNLSDGTPIVSNRSTGGAITGTVSVVNLTTGKETEEIPVGLQPTAMYLGGSARCSLPTPTTTACQ